MSYLFVQAAPSPSAVSTLHRKAAKLLVSRYHCDSEAIRHADLAVEASKFHQGTSYKGLMEDMVCIGRMVNEALPNSGLVIAEVRLMLKRKGFLLMV